MGNITLYMFILLGALVIALFVWNFITHTKLRKLSAGKKVSSLESIIIETHEYAKKQEEKIKEQDTEITELKKMLSETLRHSAIVKFDALQNTGGLQSFALALLDDNQNGVILSSLYMRDRMSVFAKEIQSGNSVSKLSDEEQKALKEALLSN